MMAKLGLRRTPGFKAKENTLNSFLDKSKLFRSVMTNNIVIRFENSIRPDNREARGKILGQSLFLWDLTHDPTNVYAGRHPWLNPEGMLDSI